jgi:uncharacterized protein YndB with AHSA1/START domain
LSASVSVSRVIDAPPQKIFDLLADPDKHPVLDGSGTVKGARGNNPQRLSLGAKFGMDMQIGVPYRIKNTVVEFEEGTRIAWRHAGRHVWRYELEPAGGGTKVTETFDWSKAFTRLLGPLVYRRTHPRMMEATLDRIEREVTSP